MNILYLLPPQWIPISPHTAVPSLIGQYAGTGHNASAMDLSLEYYCEVLTKEYLQKQLEKTLSLSESLYKEISKFYERGKDFETYTEHQKTLFAKHVMIKDLLNSNDLQFLNSIPYLIDGAVRTMRS